MALILSAGSVPGALIGVRLNTLMPVQTVSLVLYGFILLSSIILLNRQRGRGENAEDTHAHLHSPSLLVLIGFFTAAFCSFAGAGGPILVVPILAMFALPAKEAVGTALLNSVFIGITASLGYSLTVGL